MLFMEILQETGTLFLKKQVDSVPQQMRLHCHHMAKSHDYSSNRRKHQKCLSSVCFPTFFQLIESKILLFFYEPVVFLGKVKKKEKELNGITNDGGSESKINTKTSYVYQMTESIAIYY